MRARDISEFLTSIWSLPEPSSDIHAKVFHNLIFTSNTDGCYNISNLLFYNYRKKNESETIKSVLRDSVLFYDGLSNVIIKNVFNGKTYYSNFRERKFYSGSTSPLISNDSLFYSFLNANKTLVCINARTGSISWQKDFSSTINIRPVWNESTLFVYDGATLLMLDRKNGNLIHSHPFNLRLGSELVLNGATLLLWFYEKGLVAYDVGQRTERWQFNAFNLALDKFNHKLIVRNDTLYFAVGNDLISLNATNGQTFWKNDQRNTLRIDDVSNLHLVGNYLLFYDFIGNEKVLTAFNTRTRTVEFSGYNRNAIPGHQVKGDEMADIDHFKIKFIGNSHDNKLVIGQLRDSLYGFRLRRNPLGK
jgi:outer membrane protein assembly factor BamB